ncbi:MAG: ATP-dependent DNA helicase [Mariprofundaceae bacterium]
MGDLRARVLADLAADGSLARRLPGYVERREQQRLAASIAEAIEAGGALIAEAETGTGKTLAYLLPALHGEGKVLISTHTRALQDQIVHRDLPAVMTALNVRRRVALLKGRANYLCPHRLERALAAKDLTMFQQKLLLRVRAWAERSSDGDLAGLSFDPFARGIGGRVTATSEQCLGSRCESFDRCPLMNARRRAQAADIVVTNHSLLLADAALKASDYGEVLPDFDAWVIDEAHALPQLASQHFGVQLGPNRFTRWFNDMQELLEETGDEPDLRRSLGEHMRALLEDWKRGDLRAVADSWTKVTALVVARVERGEAFIRMSERAEQILDEIGMAQEPPQGFVGWRDGEGESMRHVVAPVETGPVLADRLWLRAGSVVLLSATLRVSGSFAHARRRLGLPEDVREGFHPSPFDYGRQALIYLPRHLPEGRSASATRRICDEMEALLRASSGRAFVLFTSWDALNRIAPVLARRLPWEVLIQGDRLGRDAMLEAFRRDTHSVLCGTRSFWEGVDVPGESLSMVIIDKVPFAPPNDPLLSARIRQCEAQGGNAFADIQLPEAIAVLRQGAGRLIRGEHDRGVMALLDSRVYDRQYGLEVVRNLPPAPITANIEEVRAFFARADADAA